MGIGSNLTKSTSELRDGPKGRPPSPPGSVPLMRKALMRSNGAGAGGANGAGPGHMEECTCCPYGFHIDLDFVQYTEDVATGHYRKHLRQLNRARSGSILERKFYKMLRKAKKKMRKSMEVFLQQNPEVAEETRGSVYDNSRGSFDSTEHDTSLDRSGALSPLESIFSDSLENVMSDFEETYSNQHSFTKQASRQKGYNSDMEVASSRPARLPATGYQSDYGYAVPSTLDKRRQQSVQPEPQSAPPPVNHHNPPGQYQFRPKLGISHLTSSASSSSKPLASILKRSQPTASEDLSPSRRMARSDYLYSTHRDTYKRPPEYNSDYAAPSDLADMSDSVSSVSSVSSSRNVTSIGPRGLQKVPYRGLSGQIASNLDTLASALSARTNSSRANTSSSSSTLRSASESLLRSNNPAKPPAKDAALEAMREHMAVSVSYMQDLEEQVKAVPMLNTRIDSLKRERERLVNDLERAREMERRKVQKEEELKNKLAEESPPETPWCPPASLPHYQQSVEKRAPPAAPPRSDSVDRMRDTALSPPPIPPKPPVRTSNPPPVRTVNKPAPPALIRTPSGNVMNLDAFSSVKRTSNLDLSASPLVRSRSATSYRRRSEDDCVSDSELAVGDKSLDRHASLRRSKRILAELGSRTDMGKTNSKQHSKMEDVMSDTEDYYSIGYSADRKPKTLYSYANQLNVSEDDAFRQQLVKWREEFEATAARVTDIHEQTTTVKTNSVQKRDTGMMHNPTTQNAHVETAAEPVKSQANIMHIQSPCPVCTNKSSSSSVGVGTGPLTMPKPSASLEAEVEKLREQLRISLEKPATFTVGCATEATQGLNRPSRPTMTDPPALSSTACMTLPEPPKPTLASTVTQTGDERYWTLEIGTMTDRATFNTTAINTEDKLFRHTATSHDRYVLVQNGHIQDFGTNTERSRGLSIAVGTDFEPVTNKPAPVTAEIATETDLIDLDAILEELTEQRQQIPKLIVQLRKSGAELQVAQNSARLAHDASLQHQSDASTAAAAAAAAASSKPDVCDKMVSTDSVATSSQAVATDRTVTCSKTVNTEPQQQTNISTKDNGFTTDPVKIVSGSSHSVGTGTERVRQRSLYVATDKLDHVSKATDTHVRTQDAAAVCTLIQEAQEPQRPQMVDRACSEDRVDTTVFVTGPPVPVKPVYLRPPPIETNDFGGQTEVEEGEKEGGVNVITYEVRKVEEYGGGWPPVARINVGCGDGSIHANTCDHCQYNSTGDDEYGNHNPSTFAVLSPTPARRMERTTVDFDSGDSSESAVSSGNELLSPISPPPPILPASAPPEPELDYAVDSGVTEDYDNSPRPPRKIDLKQPRGTRAYELSKAAAAKKMLLSEQQQQNNSGGFSRSNAGYRSMRVTTKKGDSLAYITTKQGNSAPSTSNKSSPSHPNQSNVGLKGKVVIKKEPSAKPKPRLPQVPARANSASPRFTRRTPPHLPTSQPETKAEAVEAEDRLTPLPSEMHMARSWHSQAYENPALEVSQGEDDVRSSDKLVSDKVEGLPDNDNDSSSSSSEESEETSDSESLEEGSYDANGNITNQCTVNADMNFELTKPLREACEILDAKLTDEDADVPEEKITWSHQYMQHEWLKACARKQANPHVVEHFLDALESYSKQLLHKVVNMCDQNENTALHYGVSHGNYDIVSLLLDSKVCNLNRPNKAGYTPVMLAALCPVEGETEQMVVQRLFQMGDVNIKASQHGQTALMLAVSHGKVENARLLLECGAGVNIQDEDGSTALMCAAEHGHAQLVKLLLQHQEIDASLTDFDGSTALSIAIENNHRDIGVLIYAHLNYARNTSANTHTHSHTTSSVTAATQQTNSTSATIST